MKHTIKAIAAAVTTATAIIIAAVAYAILIILDFSGYLPTLPAHPCLAFDEFPPERPFKQPPNFQQSKRLQNILQQIQSHIAKSTNTREHYASVCKRIDAMLLDRSARACLSEGDVKNYFNSNWPTFKPLHPSSMKFKDQILWGWTDKSTNAPNEIHLNSDLIRELEAAPEGSDLLAYLTLILIATVFHELMHHLTKITYGFQVTPAGCGGYFAVFGELGKDLEILLLGGMLTVLWKTQHLGEMEKIQLLLLVYHGQEWVLLAEMCLVMINSLATPEFETTPISGLMTYVQQEGIEWG